MACLVADSKYLPARTLGASTCIIAEPSSFFEVKAGFGPDHDPSWSNSQPSMKIRRASGAAVAGDAATVQPTSAFAALRHRNYQLYFGGQLVSNAGTWMQTVAQGWLIWQLSHSGLMLGVVGFASAIPSLFVTPWGGVVVDRMPRRRLLMMTQSGAMLLAFILAALTFTGIVQELAHRAPGSRAGVCERL